MPKGELREGYVIEHPNREKAGSKATKAIVVLLILVSVALMLVVTIGGWDTLVGAKPLQIAYIVIYLVLAFFIARWTRGALPLTAALAIILTIFAVVSAPAWFDRDKAGFAEPPVPSDVLGLVCIGIAIAQVLLIAFALRAFAQAWNVEVERPAKGRDEAPRGDAAPQPA
jgi:hypothetical protein